MNERLQQLMSFHEGLEQNRRNALYASILLAVLVIAGVGYWSNSAATRAVMTHASYDDLTTALGVLDEAEIVGTIDNEGNLWVDSSQLGAAKRALVGKSHLHSIADLLRQAEGDIAKTLNDYDYVLASNVAITPFQEGLFKGEDEPATASIQLKLRPNTDLSQEQVRSVVASVSKTSRTSSTCPLGRRRRRPGASSHGPAAPFLLAAPPCSGARDPQALRKVTAGLPPLDGDGV